MSFVTDFIILAKEKVPYGYCCKQTESCVRIQYYITCILIVIATVVGLVGTLIYRMTVPAQGSGVYSKFDVFTVDALLKCNILFV